MAASPRCPICRQATVPGYRPFCSKRCADVDLARWLGGVYVVAGGSDDADEDGEDAHARGIASASSPPADHPDPASTPRKPWPGGA
jgi:endogenous inhibitor of DNA gyrase (YacG/DUF329 family)